MKQAALLTCIKWLLISLRLPLRLRPLKSIRCVFLTASNDGTLAFSYNGDLYTKQPTGEPKKVPIRIATDAKSNNERIVPIEGGVSDLAVSPNGKEVAFIYRGEVFVSSVEGSVTKRVTNTPEQERGGSSSPDGKTLLYASERGKGWKV